MSAECTSRDAKTKLCQPKQSRVSGAVSAPGAVAYARKGLIATALPIQTGCLSRCQQGPVILVEPGHTMYVDLTKEKIDRIIEEHIIGGKVVEEYVIAEEFWGEPVSPASLI